ncbi:hypothetical protein ACFYUH_24935 [Streptomyces fimicarius]|uniref:hypothetical protein n=1 Tax=Streptomyces griseus TaxID=1911 RepID=UPI0036948EDF
MKTLKAIRTERLGELRREYETRLREADEPDPRFTAEANRTRREAARREVQQEALEALAALEEEAEAAITRVRSISQQQSPLSASDALLAETRQARAWDRVRPMLEANRSVQDLVRGADLDTLQALRAELPAFLSARVQKPQGLDALGWTEPDTDRALRLVDQAMVPLLPSGPASWKQAGLDLAAMEPGLRLSLQGFREEVTTPGSGRGLENAIAVRLADQEAGEAAA